MKNSLFILVVLFSMCKSKTADEPPFDGEFSGTEGEYRIKASISTNDDKLRGSLTINGNTVKLNGKVEGNTADGVLYDAAEDKEYDFTGSVRGNTLRLTISSGKGGETEELVLERKEERRSASRVDSDKKNEERDSRLIGEWVGSEILGTGETTMTNESVIEFMEDGTCLTWPGRSSGPGYYRDEDKSKAAKGKWRTAGRKLYFIDPATNEDAATEYTVSDNGLLLSDGGSKKQTFRRRN